MTERLSVLQKKRNRLRQEGTKSRNNTQTPQWSGLDLISFKSVRETFFHNVIRQLDICTYSEISMLGFNVLGRAVTVSRAYRLSRRMEGKLEQSWKSHIEMRQKNNKTKLPVNSCRKYS